MEIGRRTYVRKYFDNWEDAEKLNQELTEIDRQERPELYEYEGSVWCEPQQENEQWYVITWI